MEEELLFVFKSVSNVLKKKKKVGTTFLLFLRARARMK